MADPVFHLTPLGRMGNLMIEYMVALKFADMVPGCRISNISIPGWKIHHPPFHTPGTIVRETRDQYIDLPSLAGRMMSGEIARVEWQGFGQRMENLLPVERYHDVFVSPFDRNMGYGLEYLVCPIRAEDILSAPHPDYVLTPVEFYRDIVDLTGLTPVFIGQTSPNYYMDRMRAAFPDALYREPQDDPLVDFETIRQSKNVVVGVSTYIWVAAWLSRDLDNIYMAVNGLFNPLQMSEVDLLPFGDKRFKFTLFPVNYAVPFEQHAELHRRIAPYWRQVSHEVLRRQIAEAPRFRPKKEDLIETFDEDYYLRAYPDIAAVAETQGRSFARHHYIQNGIQEGRLPMPFNPMWYANQYPLAGFEVSQGDYPTFFDHYAAIGRARGYRPYPGARGIVAR